MGRSERYSALNTRHPSISYESPIISFVGDERKNGKIRQAHLWEKGRPPPDLSPYEERLREKLRPLIRRDMQDDRD